MNLLAIDTSTEVFAIAVQRGTHVLEQHGPGGAQASATLIPAIQALLAQVKLPLNELDAIVFGRGPGSFTGLRTACAVTQGLAFGANVPVLPLDTLLAVADEARHLGGVTKVVALLDARMDQVYAGRYVFDGDDWTPQGPIVLAAPEDVVLPAGWALAGNAFDVHDKRLPPGTRFEVLPTATALLRLAPARLAAGGAIPAAQALPLYVRDKVAQTTEERAAARAAPPSRP